MERIVAVQNVCNAEITSIKAASTFQHLVNIDLIFCVSLGSYIPRQLSISQSQSSNYKYLPVNCLVPKHLLRDIGVEMCD